MSDIKDNYNLNLEVLMLWTQIILFYLSSTLFGCEKEFSSIGLDDVSTVFVDLERTTLDSNPSIEISILTVLFSKFTICTSHYFFLCIEILILNAYY
jgi:hypothetical protein